MKKFKISMTLIAFIAIFGNLLSASDGQLKEDMANFNGRNMGSAEVYKNSLAKLFINKDDQINFVINTLVDVCKNDKKAESIIKKALARIIALENQVNNSIPIAQPISSHDAINLPI